MNAKEALQIAEKGEGNTLEALQTLAKLHKIRQKIGNQPTILTQEKINKFFKDIDSNGQYDDWKFVQINNVRSYFKSNFIGNYTLPDFPFINDELKKARKQISKVVLPIN